MHFQTKVLIVSVLIVCVMAGAIGSFWYRQTSKQAQSSAERYICLLYTSDAADD